MLYTTKTRLPEMPPPGLNVFGDATVERLLAMLAWFEANHAEVGWQPPEPGPRPLTANMFRWGKLDGALSAGGTQDVSLWQTTGGGWEGWDEDSTQNEEDVYAPPLLTSGSLSSGDWVLIGKINGRWCVILGEC